MCRLNFLHEVQDVLQILLCIPLINIAKVLFAQTKSKSTASFILNSELMFPIFWSIILLEITFLTSKEIIMKMNSYQMATPKKKYVKSNSPKLIVVFFWSVLIAWAKFVSAVYLFVKLSRKFATPKRSKVTYSEII